MSGSPSGSGGAAGSVPARSASSRRRPLRNDLNQWSDSEEVMPFRLEILGAFHGLGEVAADFLPDHRPDVPEIVADVVLPKPGPGRQILVARHDLGAAQVDRGIHVELDLFPLLLEAGMHSL